MAKQNLVIGQKYKVVATPDEGMVCDSIIVNDGTVETQVDPETGVGTHIFTMNSNIQSISARFIEGGGEQEVDIDDKPEGGSVEIQEENS